MRQHTGKVIRRQVRVAHGHLDIPMTKNPLQRQNIPALHHVVTSEGMPENVRQLAGSV